VTSSWALFCETGKTSFYSCIPKRAWSDRSWRRTDAKLR